MRPMSDCSDLRAALERILETDPYHSAAHSENDFLAALEQARAALAAPAADGLDVERLRRFEEHTGGLHCSEYHPEGTCEWQERCDEPGCKVEATCGFPVDGGYRRTCGDHMLAAMRDPSREPGEEG